jgi:hypothetical protein
MEDKSVASAMRLRLDVLLQSTSDLTVAIERENDLAAERNALQAQALAIAEQRQKFLEQQAEAEAEAEAARELEKERERQRRARYRIVHLDNGATEITDHVEKRLHYFSRGEKIPSRFLQ